MTRLLSRSQALTAMPSLLLYNESYVAQRRGGRQQLCKSQLQQMPDDMPCLYKSVLGRQALFVMLVLLFVQQ